MAFEYTIDPELHLITIRFSGTFLLEDAYHLRQQLIQDPSFNPDYNVIHDVTEVVNFNIKDTDILKISGIHAAKPGVKRAIVARSRLQRYMARTYQVLSASEGQHFVIFPDYESAVNWIKQKGLTPKEP